MAEQSDPKRGKRCNRCKSWAETMQQCPGHGFCIHPTAQSTKVAPGTSLSCMMLPGNTPCKLAR